VRTSRSSKTPEEARVEYERVLLIPLGRLRKNSANPNEQDERTFNATVASIQEEGWLQPMCSVVPLGEIDPSDPIGWAEFEIVGGHHRYDAAGVLGLEEGPCWLLDPAKFDQDRRDWSMMKMNVIAGKVNPEKFARLYESLVERYDAEQMQALMGFTSEDAFRKVYKQVKDSLPEELRDALESVKDEIRTIDDLSLVLNRLFRDHGETLPSNMMVFSWAGKDVLWVRADDALWKLVKEIAGRVDAEHGDMSQTLYRMLRGAEVPV
jgi:hypothetical protein